MLAVHPAVLVQREMESWRAPLASIAPIPPGQFAAPKTCGGRRQGQRLKLQLVQKRRSGWLATKRPTGYKKDIDYTRRQAREQSGVPGHQVD
jgi:hypothetical protein